LALHETRVAFVADVDDDLCNSLAGTDSARLAAEIESHANDWDSTSLAFALALSPTLLIRVTHGNGGANKALADTVRAQRKGKSAASPSTVTTLSRITALPCRPQ
jgi:hypothetical protein